MTKEQAMVRDFMLKFQQEVKTLVGVPSSQVRILRANLILEEAFELVQALGVCFDVQFPNGEPKFEVWDEGNPVDIAGVADGMGDLHYVAYCGTALSFGIDMEPVFREIHRSNMSKLWQASELEQAKRDYPEATVQDFGGGLYRLLRTDGKTIKSPSYSPANIKPLLIAQGASL